MREKIKKAIETIKGWAVELYTFFKSLPLWAKVLFVIVFIFVKFILPDAIFMPMLLKWVRKHNEKPIED